MSDSTTTDVTRKIEDLPCWKCENPAGADLRRSLAQVGGIVDEAQCSPYTGLPIGCCRIRSAVVMQQADNR
jgi:hypothetical protein